MFIQSQWYSMHYNLNWIIYLEKKSLQRTASSKYNDSMPIYIMIMHIFTAKHVCFVLAFVAGNYRITKGHYCSRMVIGSEERIVNKHILINEKNEQC